MSKIKTQPIQPADFASVSFQITNSPSSALEIKQGKDVALDPHELQPPPTIFASAYVCVPQANFVQPAVSNGSGPVTNFFPSLVSALLVVIGWYVVNKMQSNRERRKQIREYVSDLCDDLEKLEVLTVGYHTGDREEAKEHEIISKLGRFEKTCSTLPRFLQSQKYFKAVSSEKLNIDGLKLQILRKAMTLNHFGDEHTGALSLQDVHIQNLELAYMEMQDALERVRIDSLD